MISIFPSLEKALSQIRNNLETFLELGDETEEGVKKALYQYFLLSVDLQEAAKKVSIYH